MGPIGTVITCHFGGYLRNVYSRFSHIGVLCPKRFELLLILILLNLCLDLSFLYCYFLKKHMSLCMYKNFGTKNWWLLYMSLWMYKEFYYVHAVYLNIGVTF